MCFIICSFGHMDFERHQISSHVNRFLHVLSLRVLNGPKWFSSRKIDPPGLPANGQISAYEQSHIHTYYTLYTCTDVHISIFANSLPLTAAVLCINSILKGVFSFSQSSCLSLFQFYLLPHSSLKFGRNRSKSIRGIKIKTKEIEHRGDSYGLSQQEKTNALLTSGSQPESLRSQ